MDRKTLKQLWEKHKLSARNSYTPDFIRKICKEFQVKFDEKLIYTNERYRELSDGSPRVDAEELLLFVCKQHNIRPDANRLALSRKLFGEGSRREQVEKAYLESE